jgi:hypothetical protein
LSKELGRVVIELFYFHGMHSCLIRHVLWLPYLGASIGGWAQTEQYRIGPSGSWVAQHELGDGGVTDTACLRGGEEILLLDRQYDLGGQSVYWRNATKLISSEGVQNGSRFEISFDPTFQQLTLHHLRIIRNGKVIDKLDRQVLRILQREEDMNSFLYDGSLTVTTELKDVRIGDVIDYALTIKGWNPVDRGRFHRYLGMGYGVPVARSFTRLVAPKGRKPLIKYHLFNEKPTIHTIAGGEEIYWDLGPLACIQSDNNVPGWYNAYPGIDISEFASVEDLRAWAIQEYSMDQGVDASLGERIARFKALPSVMDRIDSAVHLVQREVRYLGLEGGISAYRPHAPSQVYEQRFGDCKDKSLLLATILQAVGVNAFPALVNTVSGEKLTDHLPRPSLFDHCITVIPMASDTLWVDGTYTHNGGTGAGRYTPNYGQALVVGAGFEGYTSMHVNDTGTMEVMENIVLEELGGGGDLRIEVILRGRRADAMRADMASESLTELSKSYRDFYAGIYGPCSEVEPLLFKDDPVNNVFITYEHYRIEQAWDTLEDGSAIVFKTSAYYIRDHQSKPGKAERTAPFFLGEPVDVHHRITVELPERWNVSTEDVVHEGQGIVYSRAITLKGYKVVTLDHYYSSTLPYIEAKDAMALHDLQRSIDDELYYDFTRATGEDEVALISWEKWFFILFCIGVSVFGALRVYRYDPLPHAATWGKRPQKIGGFLVLPAIGLCFSPLQVLYDMLSDDAAFFHSTDYTSLVATQYPLAVDLYTHLSQFIGFAMLAFSILLIVLYFHRRTSTPLLMKVLYIASLVWLVVDYTIYQALDFAANGGAVYSTKDITRSFFAACIWVPVFHLSERVRSTFTEQLDPNAPPLAMRGMEQSFSSVAKPNEQ